MDNYGGSADQLDCNKVTYNWPGQLGSDTKRGVSYTKGDNQATGLWYIIKGAAEGKIK